MTLELILFITLVTGVNVSNYGVFLVHFLVFGLNTGQKVSVFEQFLRSDFPKRLKKITLFSQVLIVPERSH